MYDLEAANCNDPVAFWRHIADLGPKKKSAIPWEVYVGEDNSIVTDHNIVLDKWKNDFHGLLTPPDTRTKEQIDFEKYITDSNRER